MNLKFNEWPTRYEVGMMFLRDDGEVVECVELGEFFYDAGVIGYNGGVIGSALYDHGSKYARISYNQSHRLNLTKWLNPSDFPDVPRIGQEKPSVPYSSLHKPKPQYDRDEVLRVATALVGSLESRYRSDAPIAYAVIDAINLIDAVNKQMEGGDHAIR